MARTTKKRPNDGTHNATTDPNAELDKKLRELQGIHQEIEQAFVLMRLNGIAEENTVAFKFILDRHRKNAERIIELLKMSPNKKLKQRVEMFIENDTGIVSVIKEADDPVFEEGFEHIRRDFVGMRGN